MRLRLWLWLYKNGDVSLWDTSPGTFIYSNYILTICYLLLAICQILRLDERGGYVLILRHAVPLRRPVREIPFQETLYIALLYGIDI